jgi:hypothetical protein
MTTTTPHTAWCGRGHLCNLDEHRSQPLTWRTAYGALVATLTQRSHARTAYLELRIRVTIPTDEPTARRQAAAIAAGVDRAIRTATGIPATRRPR